MSFEIQYQILIFSLPCWSFLFQYMQFLLLIRLWKCLQCISFNEILVSAKTLHDKLKLLITSNYKLVWNSFHRLKTMNLVLLVNYPKYCFYWATYTKTNILSILKNPDKIKTIKIYCSCSYFIKPQIPLCCHQSWCFWCMVSYVRCHF